MELLDHKYDVAHHARLMTEEKKVHVLRIVVPMRRLYGHVVGALTHKFLIGVFTSADEGSRGIIQ